ncbi:MAG: pyruvate formate lyase family protein [Limnochordia bacterium]
MLNAFYINKIHLDREFIEPHWSENSGQDASTLSRNLRALVDQNLHLPMSLLRAKALDYVLSHAQIEINPYNIFADKINLGIKYSTYAESDILADNLYYRFNQEIQEREIPTEYRRNAQAERIGIGTAWADYWHTLPDWQDVLSLGFSGLLQRAEEMKAAKAAAGTLTREQEIFYDAVSMSYRAILKYIRRLYEESLHFDIPHYSECLKQIMVHPPQTMYEVLETVYLYLSVLEIGVERGRSLGLIDRLYYPYYQADIESGRYSKEDIREMFRYFFNKFNAAKRFAAQPLALCGTNADGTDATNELTYLILDVYDELGNVNPKIQIRYHAGLSDELINKVVGLIRKGRSSIVIINDEAVYKGYERIGIPREDAVGYVPIGCYEPVIMGKEDAMICACFMNMAKAMEFAVTGGSDLLTGEVFGLETPTEFGSFAEFLESFYAHLDYLVEFFIDNINKQTALSSQINPSPVLSGSIRSCVERGKDIFSGGMRYSNTTFKCYGIATTVDSLLAVKKIVFDEKLLSMDELRTALSNDWAGYERIRLLVRRDKNKYGNNLPEPDNLMCDIVSRLVSKIVGRKNARGGVYRLGCDSITLAIKAGARMGATPDGRKAHETVSKNLCAVSGMGRNGVTALMLSTLKLDHAGLLGSEPLDYIVHPSAVRGEAGVKAMKAMFRTYFAMGGMALQGNVLDYESLLAAQKEPEKYRDLQVRLCGWNAYFVDLTTLQQNEFIKQTQCVCG